MSTMNVITRASAAATVRRRTTTTSIIAKRYWCSCNWWSMMSTVSAFSPVLVHHQHHHRRYRSSRRSGNGNGNGLSVFGVNGSGRNDSRRRGGHLLVLHHSSSSTSSSKEAAVSAATATATASGRRRDDDASSSFELRGITWIQDCVVQVLNELFDPVEIARGNAMAKLQASEKKKQKKKQKKQKKKQDDGNDEEEEEELIMSEEEKNAFIEAAVAAAKPAFDRVDAAVTAATKPEFGDYQVNAALTLSRAVANMSGRDCAAAIIEKLAPMLSDCMLEPEIAGPGFINLKFQPEYLSAAVAAMSADADDRLAVPVVADKQKIVVDYSSPNIAKEMHVGHLRSTVIGDCLAAVLEFAGHDVIRLNHVGDWGTQFGMLVEHLSDEYPAALDAAAAETVDLGDLVQLYKAAKKRFDTDDAFKARARDGVVRLQSGDPAAVAAWKSLCAASRTEYNKIYEMLNIDGRLTERGESFYNPYLATVVEELRDQNMAVDSNGALAVFLPGYANRDGSALPMIVQKSDGGYNYATTDLAAIKHRCSLETGEQAGRVLYVTDSGQSQHFDMVFAAAKQAGFYNPAVQSLEHVPFGLVQGQDGKKFATRSGDTVKLKDLLDEAVKIAGADLRERNNYTDDVDQQQIVERSAAVVGIGAVKYADLSMNRESNYRFSYNRMLSMNGNTAPYMLYAYARICGIIRKATAAEIASGTAAGQEEGEGDDKDDDSIITKWRADVDDDEKMIILNHPAEIDLARNLMKLPDVLAAVEQELYPNRMCDYLFETTQKFNQFYENCSVMKADTEQIKYSRLCLCTATAGTIKLLLKLLGIGVLEKL